MAFWLEINLAFMLSGKKSIFFSFKKLIFFFTLKSLLSNHEKNELHENQNNLPFLHKILLLCKPTFQAMPAPT